MHHRITLFLLAILVSAPLCYAQKLPETPAHKVVLEDHEKVIKFELKEDEKEVSADQQLYYTWFAHHKIHTTRGDFEGKLLHGEYLVFNKERDLLEKGIFKYGVKSKVWKSWYNDGELKSVIHFKKGKRHGYYIEFDDMGDVTTKIKYVKGKKNGTTRLFNEDGDETIIKYKNDKEVSRKRKAFFEDNESDEELIDPTKSNSENEDEEGKEKSKKEKKEKAKDKKGKG